MNERRDLVCFIGEQVKNLQDAPSGHCYTPGKLKCSLYIGGVSQGSSLGPLLFETQFIYLEM